MYDPTKFSKEDISLYSYDKLSWEFSIEIQDSLKQPIISFSIEEKEIPLGCLLVKVPLKKIELNSGNYSIVIGFVDNKKGQVLFRLENICPFLVKTKKVS